MNTIWLLALALLGYVAFTIIYRLYFHPLSKFPGPKIAAVTTLYNGYHDVVRGGQYVWVVEEMHRQYGPIVRTRPDAIHVNDHKFVETLYTQSPKMRRERFHTVLDTMQAHGSMLSTRDHDLHRRRRAALNPYFSHANVRRLEPVINDTLASLLHRMQGWAREGKPVHMNVAFRAATKDIIQAYAFGEAERCLDMEDCNAAFFDIMIPQPSFHLGTHFRPFVTIMANTPPAVLEIIVPRIALFARFMKELYARIDGIRDAKEDPEGKTIFHELVRSDMPPSEKTTKRLGDEAMVMLIAGTDTTASTLAAIMYHLLADAKLLGRLRKELETVIPDPNTLPPATKLDELPLLNAIIREALRLYPGATHRQDRLAPDEDLIYQRPSDGKIFTIPAGNGIGMTAPLLNRHADVYAQPEDFLPERYLEDPALQKHLFTFSKGSRQCLGMHLAYQELQTFTAGIFRKYNVYDPTKAEQDGPTLELFETTRADVAMAADCINIVQYKGSQGVRIVVRH